MNINFPPVDEQYLENIVADGYYSNKTEAVRDAVRRMREGRFGIPGKQNLRALQIGLDQIDRGEYAEYTPEMMKAIMQKAIQSAGNGRAYKDEVIPPSWRK